MTVEEGPRGSSSVTWMSWMAWIARLPLRHVAVFFASTGAFAAGVVLGWNSFGGWLLRASVGWDMHEADLVIGIVAAGGCLGSLLCGLVMVFHRRACAIAYAYVALLAVGWSCVYKAADKWHEYALLMIGRGLCGVGVGMFHTLLPVYIGEVTNAGNRDRLLYCAHAMLGCGVVVAYALVDVEAESLRGYDLRCALACLPALLCGLTVGVNPVESMLNGKERSARDALVFYDTSVDDREIDLRIDELRELIKKNRLCKWRCYGQFRSLLILTISHHLSGAITVLFNGLTMVDFTGSGETLTSSQLCLVSSVCQVVATFAGLALVDLLGRRILLTLSATAMTVCMALLGWTLSQLQAGKSVYPWQSPTIVALYYSAYGLGFGPILWAMLSDSFPARLRVVGASLIGASGWFVSLLLNLHLSTLLEKLGVAEMLYVFVGFSLLGALLGVCLVRETRGKSLLDLQRQFLNAG